MNRSTIEGSQPEPQYNSGQTAQDKQVNPSIANANVVCSQIPPEFSVFNLLDAICDGLIGYKAQVGNLYSVKTTLELPESSFNRIVSELKTASTSIDETDILYAGFKFCVKKAN